ncbi:hypothetical protein ABER02_18325 [Rossellomorea marisflavi]|uniref:hypothetical protein n=1 Tax=Rossellomorea marisflavi TaxID=189381 RepID=UPI003D2E6275
MEHRITPYGMDELLIKLEEDYVCAIRNNEGKSVEDFIEHFLYDSWNYNEENMDIIKNVLGRFTSDESYQEILTESFNIMVDHLRERLVELDQAKNYPVLHSKHGASLLVACVDGLVLQYYLGIYSVDKLREMTPYLKSIILHGLKTKYEG